tara:strand:+ start:9026 stop:9145 length:120 start_codon:yes stop_codon:yes gene_type:complete
MAFSRTMVTEIVEQNIIHKRALNPDIHIGIPTKLLLFFD